MKKEKYMNVVLVGHVDHGKSTVLGRLLADTDALPKGKLEQVKATCERNSKPFEYAFLIDALKDEQEQGITIDSARVFYRGDKRDYIFIDAPGHIEFLRNMVTGAARADAALLIIDAAEGVRENSKRHGFLLSMLGVEQIVVIVNKMDLVKYDRDRFESVVREYGDFLEKINVKPMGFIPVSGMQGDNVGEMSANMPWYEGNTVFEALDTFIGEKEAFRRGFRMPVQGVYKFTEEGDDRRIVAGTVIAGSISKGDEVIFYPSGKKSTVKSIEEFNAPPRTSISAGKAAGFTLTEQIYVTRGEMAINAEEPLPCVTSRLKVSLFWMGASPMVKGKQYYFKLGTARIAARLENIEKMMDTSDLESDKGEVSKIEKNALAECVLKLNKPVAFDLVSDFQGTSRFVMVDDFNIAGGGIVRESLPDDQSWLRDKVLVRDYKWVRSGISSEERSVQYGHGAMVLFLTGGKDAGKKPIARELEENLFARGHLVYFLGIGNVLYGVDADIYGSNGEVRQEHLRRLAEVAHIMLGAGMILLVTATDLTEEDVESIKTSIGEERVGTVWVGGNVATDIEPDLVLKDPTDKEGSVNHIIDFLVEKQVLEGNTEV